MQPSPHTPWRSPGCPAMEGTTGPVKTGGVVSAQALREMQLLPGPCQGPAHVGLEG